MLATELIIFLLFSFFFFFFFYYFFSLLWNCPNYFTPSFKTFLRFFETSPSRHCPKSFAILSRSSETLLRPLIPSTNRQVLPAVIEDPQRIRVINYYYPYHYQRLWILPNNLESVIWNTSAKKNEKKKSWVGLFIDPRMNGAFQHILRRRGSM